MNGLGLQGKTIVLGVTGGIAAYKAAAIASLLVQEGASVEVVMTRGARRFVKPLTFSAITHAAVHTDAFAPWSDQFSGHLTLAKIADLLMVAPATASTIARLALGLSDDLLGLIALSTHAPMLLAPAMEEGMYRHPATQHHLLTLNERGAVLIGPESGRLASGASGLGRMAAPTNIVLRAKSMLQRPGLLSGVKVVVTAGGTRESIDPVRYVGNRSSGRMGFAIAEAAAATGARVTLIAGPTTIDVPNQVAFVPVESTLDMLAAVERAVEDADILIMAAAVADFRPEAAQSSKIKKTPGEEHLDLRLIRNPDILATVRRPGLIKIGFAAETENLIENAAAKLAAKQLAMIVANDAETTIGAEDSTATFLMADGVTRELPTMSKAALADEIIHTAADLYAARHRHDS
jgi:phosphopantothenoylcysteine decarboxylase/phosphopantothenate--cysteine ligase